MKTTDTTIPTDTTRITSTEKATDKVPRRAYSSIDEVLESQFKDMKKIATAPTKKPTKKTPAYPDPRKALRDIEEHSKSPQEVIAELDAEEAAEKVAEEFNSSHTISEISTFNSNLHPEFGNLRTLTIDGEPWFVGKDVAEALGYQNGSRDINRHVSEEDRQNYRNGTFESNRGMTIINESGLYSLILSSKLESAKIFKHWVTAKVLPTIRKTGAGENISLYKNILYPPVI